MKRHFADIFAVFYGQARSSNIYRFGWDAAAQLCALDYHLLF
jgi:hypothetical protein